MTTHQEEIQDPKMIAKAAVKLEKLLREKLEWIAADCFPQKVEHEFGKVGDLINAAKELGVGDLQAVDLKKMSESDRKDFLLKITNFRHLDMSDEAMILIHLTLKKVGMPEHYYEYKPGPDEKAR